MEGREHPVPDPVPGPAVEPPPDTVPVAEALGQVAPGGPCLRDPEDSIDEEAIILGDLPMLAGLPGQEVFDPRPVVIRDRMAMVHDGPSVA